MNDTELAEFIYNSIAAKRPDSEWQKELNDKGIDYGVVRRILDQLIAQSRIYADKNSHKGSAHHYYIPLKDVSVNTPVMEIQVDYIAKWEYFLRRYMDTAVRYNFSEGTTIILNDYLKQGREKWENFKASFRKKKLPMNEIEKGNFYNDLKNDFYPIAKTYYEWYEKNTTNLANLKPEINAYTALNEFCKDTINEIDTLRQVKTITGKKPLHDYLEEHRKRKMAEGEEKDKQAEIDRKKSFNTLISSTYDYSPTVQDFKEEMAVQKVQGTIKYLSFLRETKKTYINARNYYTIWGARGTGVNRLDLYNSIVNLINPELEKEIELEKVRNNDPLADGILDLKSHLSYLENNLKNLEFDVDKLFFLNTQKERTQEYINNMIKRSTEHPSLKIEGVRAEKIKVARKFLEEVDRRITAFGNIKPPAATKSENNTTTDDKPVITPQKFDYSNTNGYLLPDKITAFKEIEKELLKRNFLDGNGTWLEEKNKLCAYIHLLHGKYLRSKLPKKESWPSLLVYRRYFEERYNTDIAKAFQKNQFAPGKAKNFILDFKFIIPAEDLQ